VSYVKATFAEELSPELIDVIAGRGRQLGLEVSQIEPEHGAPGRGMMSSPRGPLSPAAREQQLLRRSVLTSRERLSVVAVPVSVARPAPECQLIRCSG
jgi:hypothetical protein